jgi:hypothetical protein
MQKTIREDPEIGTALAGGIAGEVENDDSPVKLLQCGTYGSSLRRTLNFLLLAL